MSEAKKKPPVALVALAPLVGLYALVMPYLYWRAAVWVWGPGAAAIAAAWVAGLALAAVVYLAWRST